MLATSAKDSSTMPTTPLSAFITSEMARLNWDLAELERRSKIPDTTLTRILRGQEAKPSHLARLAEAFNRPLWFVWNRAGYTSEVPGAPGAEESRLGAIFANDPNAKRAAGLFERLSPQNQRIIVLMMERLLEPESPPVPPEVQ